MMEGLYKCIWKSEHVGNFKVGKTYKFTNGSTTGEFSPTINFKSLEEFKQRCSSQYTLEEVKENKKEITQMKPIINNVKGSTTNEKLSEKEKAIQAKRERGTKIKLLRESMGIEKVLVNGKAMIVWFKDGSKIVEQCSEKDEFDPEIGLALAILHHASDNSKSLYKEVVGKILQQNTKFVK